MAEKSEGYERLAQLMGRYPQLAIFRRFGALNLQNLLFLQAELTHLEKELKLVIAMDNQNPDRVLYSQYWLALSESTEDAQPARQSELMQKIDAKLRQYNEALEQQAKVLALQSPSKEDVGFLSDWLRLPSGGRHFLHGAEALLWDESNHPDLIALKKNDKRFANVAADFLIAHFARIFGRVNLGGDENVVGLVDYEAPGLTLFMQIVTAVLSSALLMVSVVVLYFVHPAGIRLGLIRAFTIIFSLGLAIFAGADRNEIFGATAACIAVQIVFVGTN